MPGNDKNGAGSADGKDGVFCKYMFGPGLTSLYAQFPCLQGGPGSDAVLSEEIEPCRPVAVKMDRKTEHGFPVMPGI
jgi:hypothetical protein